MATLRSITATVRAGWESVCHYINKAVVFMDNPMAECLHWSAGADLLFHAGAVNIKELSSFENATREERKAVFIVSDLLADTVEEIIKDIVVASHLQYCIVITAMPHSLHVHLVGEGLGDGIVEGALFVQFEKKLRQWMGGPIAEVEVHHIPLFAAPIRPNLFVVPAFSSLFPLLTSDLVRVQVAKDSKGEKIQSDAVELHMLPRTIQRQLKMLVSGISGLCEQLKINEDVYAIGHSSKLVATELASLQSAKARRKAAQHRASILLIDRTMDLAGAVSHLCRETLADRVLCHLDRLPGHSVDVGVNMADLFSLDGAQSVSSNVICPGCLSHPSDSLSQSILNTLVTTKQKESLMDVNRQLVNVITKEKLPLKVGSKMGRVGPDTLHAHLQLFKKNPDAVRRNLALFQIASACVETLTHPKQATWEQSLGSEKLLMQSMGDEAGVPSLHQVLVMLEKHQTDKSANSLESILLLLIFAYSLAGESSASFIQDETRLKNLLIQAILSEQDLSEVMSQFVGKRPNEETARGAVKQLLEKLRAVGKARSHLQQFRSIFDHGSMVAPATYNPFLKQVLETIFSPNKPDLPDIEYKSTGLRDLIKTGFRFFVNVSKPRPGDHPLLILFILGGVTCSESRMIKETVTAHSPNTQVIIGSTCILKPTDVLHLLLCQDNLQPAT